MVFTSALWTVGRYGSVGVETFERDMKQESSVDFRFSATTFFSVRTYDTSAKGVDERTLAVGCFGHSARERKVRVI